MHKPPYDNNKKDDQDKKKRYKQAWISFLITLCVFIGIFVFFMLYLNL